MSEPRTEFERRFAQRFEAYLDDGLGALVAKDIARAAIEGQPQAAGRLRVATLAATTVLAAALVAVLVVKLLPTNLPPAAVTIPPDSAPPAVVLDAYLRALRAGDCGTASQLTDPLLLRKGFVDLCRATRVTAFSVSGDHPFFFTAVEIGFPATLTITGTANGISAGELTWFYILQQQSSGAWRIVDGIGGQIRPSTLPSPPT